ncbi:MAG TPA: hypothetical protein PKC76_09080 [Saprospiraceae bacterium]|nr:hypothetical protein [Saprospiraceae bacterium]HMP24272.1 hypothetical protein [Saprospiraceae bacterium]
MISRFRMKIDLLGQSVLVLAVVLLLCLAEGVSWSGGILIALAIWQFISAVHLFYVYKHIRRVHYLRTALILAVSLPIWIELIGVLAYLPVAGVVLWYFIQTVRDTLTVYRRPRSFWDLIQ